MKSREHNRRCYPVRCPRLSELEHSAWAMTPTPPAPYVGAYAGISPRKNFPDQLTSPISTSARAAGLERNGE
jgi:hypothetical protein